MVGIKFLKIFKEQKDIFIKNLPVQVIIFLFMYHSKVRGQ